MTFPEWQLADAKNRFSELVRRALTDGPQRVTRRGDAVVVLSAKEYERLSGKSLSFKSYLMSGPKIDGLDTKRAKDTGRTIKL